MTERAHALLSASGSERWLACPPSARLEDSFPESTSVYAKEGTLAHAICELKLRKTFEVMPKSTYAGRLKKLKADPLYKEEMMEHTDTYYDYIHKIMLASPNNPRLGIERKLDYSHIAPEGFGTGDAVIRDGDTLWVIDFKYGKGKPVSAVENTQLMLYAVGAIEEYSLTDVYRCVKIVVIQPRLENGISEWEVPVEGLLAWADSIKPTAQKAFNGEGEFSAGNHCGWCRAKATCGTRATHFMALEGFNKAVPPILDNAAIGDILLRAQGLVDWISSLEDFALAECLAGRVVPNWKAVEGRSNRRFTDVDAVFKKLIADGTAEEVLYVKNPITLTAVETLIGKKKFSELGPLVAKPAGKPTLVVATDKREVYSKSDVVEEFSVIEDLIGI
jgi:hypothetical protein